MVGETTWLDDKLSATEPPDSCGTMPEPRDSRSESQGAPGMSMRTTTMPGGETAERRVGTPLPAILERTVGKVPG